MVKETYENKMYTPKYETKDYSIVYNTTEEVEATCNQVEESYIDTDIYKASL